MSFDSQAINFGVAALFFLGCSTFAGWKSKYVLSLILGILELASAVVSSSAWAWALKISGKGDWFLFGLFGYPILGLFCWSILVLGARCVLKSVHGLAGKRNASPEAQT